MRDLENVCFRCCLACCFCCACEGDTYDILDKVPGGYELPVCRYGHCICVLPRHTTPRPTGRSPATHVSINGDGLYDDVRTSTNGTGGGLGPVYAGYSCGSCHHNAGRTRPRYGAREIGQ